MTLVIPEVKPEEVRLLDLIKEPPQGALLSWGQLELALKKDSPLYLFVLNTADDNPVLQFKHPSLTVQMNGDTLNYKPTHETLAQRKFFNRAFLPTFFIFDNYFHAMAFEAKLKPLGYQVEYRKFE